MEKEVALTETGCRKLEEELDYLVTKKRREIAKRIKEAIEFGDISENAEYDDAKNEQAFIEGRIDQITNILKNAKIISNKRKTDEVDLGSLVVLRDLESNEVVEYMLVGSAEANPCEYRISNESPVGMAIIGKKPGDKVMVQAPLGKLEYLISEIK
ncbi:transcription elongation factor GreA [Candidatus Oleimmundimicrobium sp.]|uniref:transcription elongation factor GreA n=1 Tax=Candidatus Oleimmundimicrobium sp. TaxID=3060597 RepID=UPI002716757E|nr:transcription elongation factor GreA [Candidatus Oleimmundimicrobium sp.]MDO8885988.1 transcription elongation factor GreA [Candidatus Oleimmundimicrobium sp.]